MMVALKEEAVLHIMVIDPIMMQHEYYMKKE